MDALSGAEERQVRAARRFGRIGLVLTVFWLVVPVFLLLLDPPPLPLVLALTVLFAAALALHLWRIRAHARSLGRPAPAWFVALAVVVGLAVLAAGLATNPLGSMWAVVSGILLGDVVGGRPARVVAAWVAGSVVVSFSLGVAVVAAGGFADVLPVWFAPAMAAFFVASMWTVDVERLWWLKAVTDLDDSRRVAAELATARERLRLADDLHDILGHALEVVAFKSELAARLLPVDGDRARAEMEEVQRVARASLTEVRALVRDARPTDLTTELSGARAVLGSAGVALTVTGDPGAIAPPARNVLGRVLREAMTNVLRHAAPSRCTIAIETAPGTAVLRVENDGVLPGDDGSGTGLTALSRYLDEHAGRLDAGPGPDGTFRLSARLPTAAR